MDTIDKILNLMKEKKINAAQLSREIGLTNGLITQWKKRLQKPSQTNIIKIAKYFNVSTDYLLNEEDIFPEEIKNIPLMPKDNLTLEDVIVSFYDADASEEEKEEVLNFIRWKREQRKNKNKE